MCGGGGGGESSLLRCPCQDPTGSLSGVEAKSMSGQRCKGLLNAAACAEREKRDTEREKDLVVRQVECFKKETTTEKKREIERECLFVVSL